VASTRMAIAAVVINLTLYWLKPPVMLSKVPAAQWLRLVACAVLMIYINQIFFNEGLALASATNASLIMALSPLLAAVLAAMIFREPLSRRRLLGVALG